VRQADITAPFSQVTKDHANGGSMHARLCSCLGFNTAEYGPHGTEILYLSLVEGQPISHHGEKVGAARLQLRALKITGDVNVPPRNYSFVIDVDQQEDMQKVMRQDRRRIAAKVNGQYEHVSLDQLAARTAALYRGHGQINRVPGLWEPEWVPCVFFVYEAPQPTGAKAMLVWSDDGFQSRHGMEIFTLPVPK
jgi:hypothetical protein